MADTRRQRIVRRVVELLSASHGPVGLTVHRFRTRPIYKDSLPATVPYAISERVETEDHGTHDQAAGVLRTLSLRLEHRVLVPGATPTTSEGIPDDLLEPLLTWATAQLVGDRTLGDEVLAIRETSIGWDAIEATQIYAAAGQDFEIDYWGVADDPEDLE